MRISLADARRLGIKVPGKRGDGKNPPGKTRARKKRGRDRAAKADYGSAVVNFEVALNDDPQPKERPRTVINMEGVMNAFRMAGGNAAKFEGLLKGRMARTYTPANTGRYEKLVRAHAAAAMAAAGLAPFECPVKTHVHLVLRGDPATHPTSPADGDADNLEKAVLDALNGTVFADDRLVVRSVRSKSCGPVAKVVVRVAALSARPD